jgi:thioredoxin-related protein
LEDAKKQAKAERKYILLNFSGSDWCGPCIELTRNVFQTNAFTKYATDNLVLVNADFPRTKKHQLDPKQKALNESMAEVYNKNGVFPLTLQLDENGKVIQKWEGVPANSPAVFISLLKPRDK